MGSPEHVQRHIQRRGLTARGVERELGIGRDRIIRAIQAGELRATRLGVRNLLILREDVAEWLERHRVQPSDPAKRVAEVLEREARRA